MRITKTFSSVVVELSDDFYAAMFDYRYDSRLDYLEFDALLAGNEL